MTPPPEHPTPHFGRWVASEIAPGAAVLNIGGGCNTSGPLPRIRRRAGRLVTVDPSGRIHGDSDADERYQLTLEEFAGDHGGEFDVAFAVFVLEHVARPREFTEAAAHVLRPGGLFFALTPNKRHYFGLATWTARRLGLEDRVLRALRDAETVDGYHVPTEYRLNSISTISRHLGRAGFGSVLFHTWDLPRMYEPYLPAPLKRVAPAWSDLAYRSGRPNLMGHLTLRATR